MSKLHKYCSSFISIKHSTSWLFVEILDPRIWEHYNLPKRWKYSPNTTSHPRWIESVRLWLSDSGVLCFYTMLFNGCVSTLRRAFSSVVMPFRLWWSFQTEQMLARLSETSEEIHYATLFKNPEDRHLNNTCCLLLSCWGTRSLR